MYIVYQDGVGQEMPQNYQIEHIRQGNYLRVRPLAPLTRELISDYSMAAHTQCRSEGCNGYLFDLRGIENACNPVDNYDFVYRDMEEMKLLHSIKSAVLIDEADDSHSFPELLLQNAGYNIRFFSDEQEAIEWLVQTG